MNELRNVKGGGIHYVAYIIIHSVTTKLPKLNSSELVWDIADPTTIDSSKTLEDHQILTSTIISTTKE